MKYVPERGLPALARRAARRQELEVPCGQRKARGDELHPAPNAGFVNRLLVLFVFAIMDSLRKISFRW
jgi:hypothetical protein